MRSQSAISHCHDKAIALLKRNLGASGVLAATSGKRANERGYNAVFARDAAICAIGMMLSGDATLKREASRGLLLLAEHQARNGQLPKFVDGASAEPDFWYLGCIDATLWWLIAIATIDRLNGGDLLQATQRQRIALALQWLLAQEHQRFFLLQQNEASDWADIMPRSGFVLYTNALWYHVKKLYVLEDAEATRNNFEGLFHPFSADLAEYRRARLLADFALQSARNRDLYLSFVNFSFYGDEGDVFGNVLAVLLGLTDQAAQQRTLDALIAAEIHEPYPVRAVCDPIGENDRLWRAYMARHDQNFAWQYHNGGIWPMVGGFWICALVHAGRHDVAQAELLKLADCAALGNWQFNEWLHGRSVELRGMPGQSWNAAAFLMAEHAVQSGRHVFEL